MMSASKLWWWFLIMLEFSASIHTLVLLKYFKQQINFTLVTNICGRFATLWKHLGTALTQNKMRSFFQNNKKRFYFITNIISYEARQKQRKTGRVAIVIYDSSWKHSSPRTSIRVIATTTHAVKKTVRLVNVVVSVISVLETYVPSFWYVCRLISIVHYAIPTMGCDDW